MNEEPRGRWLNRTVLGVGLTSLFSDWSHEIATAVLPAFLATIGAGPAWLGAIEGVADGLSSFTKLAAGHFTDRLKRRKPLAVAGYAVTTLATASFAFATRAYQLLAGRTAAWFGRGVRSPAKKTLLAADVPPEAYGRAFGLERLMDTLGAIAGPLTALWLLETTRHNYRSVFLWTLVPGLVAVTWRGPRRQHRRRALCVAQRSICQRGLLQRLAQRPCSQSEDCAGLGLRARGRNRLSAGNGNALAAAHCSYFRAGWNLYRHGRSSRGFAGR